MYLSNSACQAASDMGGKAPVNGRHSVIDNPLSVSRVNPPTTIIVTTRANKAISQARTAPRDPRLALSITPV